MSSHLILHIYFADEDHRPTDAPLVFDKAVALDLLTAALDLTPEQPQHIERVTVDYQ